MTAVTHELTNLAIDVDTDATRRAHQLSARELAVVWRIVDGRSIKEVAFELSLSTSSTATYLARARRKLQQSSRWKLTAAVAGSLPCFREIAASRGLNRLSDVDLAVGDDLLAGLSNLEIARRTSKLPSASGKYISRLLAKLGISTRADLFTLARALRDSGPANAPIGSRTDRRPAAWP